MTNSQSRMEEPICTICQENFDHGVIQITECNHMFHEECIQPWFEQSDECPNCRHPQNLEEGEIEDDEGFVEFRIHHYSVAEMLPIYDLFQAIALALGPDNEGRAVRPHRIPVAFQNMMEVLPPDEFEAIHDDVHTVEIIHAYLDGEFDRENPVRGYAFNSDYSPDIRRMLNIYESFVRHRQNNFYEAFERFLNSLRAHEEYALFRTRNHRNLFDRFN